MFELKGLEERIELVGVGEMGKAVQATQWL